MFKYFGFLIFCFLLIDPCFAQDGFGLSQVAFDEALEAKSAQTNAVQVVDPQQILQSGEIAVTEPAKAKLKPPPMKVRVRRISSAQRGQLSRGVAAVFSDPAETHLIPRLKGDGPLETSKDGSSISSYYRWRGTKGSCSEPKGRGEMCRKAVALRELLRRFTGGNEAYDTRCSFDCKNPKYESALVGIALADTKGGAFRFQKVGDDECTYELEKSPEKSWMMLEVAREHCACVPKRCLSQ